MVAVGTVVGATSGASLGNLPYHSGTLKKGVTQSLQALSTLEIISFRLCPLVY